MRYRIESRTKVSHPYNFKPGDLPTELHNYCDCYNLSNHSNAVAIPFAGFFSTLFILCRVSNREAV